MMAILTGMLTHCGVYFFLAIMVFKFTYLFVGCTWAFSSCTEQGSFQWCMIVVCWVCCSKACGIFSGQGSDPCLLHWQANSFTEPPGKPPFTPGSLLPNVYYGPCRPWAKMFNVMDTVVHCPDPLFNLKWREHPHPNIILPPCKQPVSIGWQM